MFLYLYDQFLLPQDNCQIQDSYYLSLKSLNITALMYKFLYHVSKIHFTPNLLKYFQLFLFNNKPKHCLFYLHYFLHVSLNSLILLQMYHEEHQNKALLMLNKNLFLFLHNLNDSFILHLHHIYTWKFIMNTRKEFIRLQIMIIEHYSFSFFIR